MVFILDGYSETYFGKQAFFIDVEFATAFDLKEMSKITDFTVFK